MSNFIRERRRTRSYIGRKDMSCSTLSGTCERLKRKILGICQHSQQHDILAKSFSKPAESLLPNLVFEEGKTSSQYGTCPKQGSQWLPKRFNVSRSPLRKIETIDGPHNDVGKGRGWGGPRNSQRGAILKTALTLQVMSVTLVQPWNSTSEPFFLTCAHSLTQ